MNFKTFKPSIRLVRLISETFVGVFPAQVKMLLNCYVPYRVQFFRNDLRYLPTIKANMNIPVM